MFKYSVWLKNFFLRTQVQISAVSKKSRRKAGLKQPHASAFAELGRGWQLPRTFFFSKNAHD